MFIIVDRMNTAEERMIGCNHTLSPNALTHNLKDCVLEHMEAGKVSFNLQVILCKMQEFYAA